jgi:hypothetical protein
MPPPESTAFIAAHMLIELNRDLQRQGKRIVLARQVGQVRDILTTERRPTAIEIYPSVRRRSTHSALRANPLVNGEADVAAPRPWLHTSGVMRTRGPSGIVRSGADSASRASTPHRYRRGNAHA